MRLKLHSSLSRPVGMALVALSAVVSPAYARAPKAPPLSSASVVGTWEAVDAESLQLFVLKIEGLEPSKVGIVEVSGSVVPVVISFQATSVALDKTGRLVVNARAEQRGVRYVAEIRATGSAEATSGIMRGTVAVGTGSTVGVPGASIVFTKSEEGLARWLVRVRTMAQETLDRKSSSAP